MTSIWSIAGHDPFGGAGIAADQRVAAALNIPLRSLIATFTAQNDQKVFQSSAVPDEWFEAQWNAVHAAENPSCIKVGLVRSLATLEKIREKIALLSTSIILDPVLEASAGGQLCDPGIEDGLRRLFPRLSLLTPNRPEAERLVGFPIRSHADRVLAAQRLREMGVAAVLIKGGHDEGAELSDYFDDGQRSFVLNTERQPGHYRGTGCSLSTAIACYIARGYSLRESVVAAHAYVQAAVRLGRQGETSLFHLPSVPFVPSLARLSYNDQDHQSLGDDPAFAFADLGSDPIGFYPVLPSLEWVRRLAPTGIKTVQLRIKEAGIDELRAAVREANEICRRHDIRLFVNDAWEIALETKAYGVHLGQEDLDNLSARDLARMQAAGLRLGVSTHSLEEAARAAALRPSYVALGPIRPTTCKSMAFGPQGFARIGEWKSRLPGVPLVAIGGLKVEHAAEALREGADGVAVISDVTEHSQPEARVAEWLSALSEPKTSLL